MNEQAIGLLNALAAKLGTTADYLWGVLLKQAPVSAVISVFEVIACAVFIWLFIKYLPWAQERLKDYGSDIIGFMYCAIGGILTVVFATCIFVNFENAIIAMANPEYWALDRILSILKPRK